MTRTALTLLLILGLTIPAGAATFVVSSAGPVGPGTLDQAIADANATPGHDTIVFAVGSGSVVITPSGRAITDDVTINGRTQPGYANEPLIVINNTNNNGSTCLAVNAANGAMSDIDALAFRNCGFYALEARSPVRLRGNDFRGPSNGSANGISLYPGGSGSVIGGTSASDRNTIGGYYTGITFQAAGPNRITDVIIQGNYIGLDATSTSPVPNTFGIAISGGERILIGGTTPGARNVISGNRIGASLSGSQITVAGNYIGTSPSGLAALPNESSGISVASSSTTIGGTDVAARNVIAGNGRIGLSVSGTNVQATNNYIGVDATGTAALPNRYAGVFVGQNSNEVDIGRPGAGNVIAGTLGEADPVDPGDLGGYGVLVAVTSGPVRIRGNLIGLNAAGTAPLPNIAAGIDITSPRVTVGGLGSGEGNRIESNGGAGVNIESFGDVTDVRIEGNSIRNNGREGMVLGPLYAGFSDYSEVRIQQNSISSNGRLGIDIRADGVTPNDPGDPDLGPNASQNYPNLTSATAGASTSIVGTLESTPSTAFTIEFFASSQADPSTYGEGATFLGSTNVTTNAAGSASFVFEAPARAGGEVITATATGPRGTSEFSRAVTVTSTAAIPTLSPLTMLLLAAMLAGIAALSIVRS